MSGRDTLSGVYAIVHQPSGRAHVGSSCDVFRRWRGHASGLSNGHHHAERLLNLWLLDGPAAFTFVVLEQCPPEALQEREQEWLDSFEAPLNTNASVMWPAWVADSNRRRTGQKRTHPVSAETRAAISAGHLGRRHSPEARARMSAAQRGRPHRQMTTEAKQKLSAWRSGRIFGPRAPEVGQKIAAALRGQPLTEERKNKISAARLGKPITEKMQQHLDRLHVLTRSDERRYRLRDLMMSPEHKAKQIESHWSRSENAKAVTERMKATRKARKESAST